MCRFQLGAIEFRWDLGKYEANVRKHGVTFEEAATTWLDPLAIERVDEEHSAAEQRWLRIGSSMMGDLLVLWSAERSSPGRTAIRIIGARRATRRERRRYEEENEQIG